MESLKFKWDEKKVKYKLFNKKYIHFVANARVNLYMSFFLDMKNHVCESCILPRLH